MYCSMYIIHKHKVSRSPAINLTRLHNLIIVKNSFESHILKINLAIIVYSVGDVGHGVDRGGVSREGEGLLAVSRRQVLPFSPCWSVTSCEAVRDVLNRKSVYEGAQNFKCFTLLY